MMVVSWVLSDSHFHFHFHIAFQVRMNHCGSVYPIYMESEHVEKGQCAQQDIYQVNSDTNWRWRGVSTQI